MGLKLLAEGNQKDAINKFTHCAKKGTYYCAKASAKKLCEFGSLQEKNKACIRLVTKFPDTDSYIIAAKHFLESNEINKIIEYTDTLNLAEDNNELIRIRLEALSKRNDSRYQNEVFTWFTSRPLSIEHYQFYRDFYAHPDFELDDVMFTPKQFIINYRIELYKRNYTYTFENARIILGYFDTGAIAPNAQLTSDMGKSTLYGNMNFANNAQVFKNFAKKYSGTPVEYYFWFYAGRLFEKAGTYVTQTKQCFQSAIDSTQDTELKDNALWYLMNTSLSTSMDLVIKNIGDYAKQWTNPEYFDDFFSTLLSSLLISGKWTSFYDIYHAVDGYATNETVAQYAYIYGRLVQEGLVTQEMTGRDTQEDINQAFTRALKADSATYYTLLSASKLQLPEETFKTTISSTGYAAKLPMEGKNPNIAAEHILEGCVLFGFPEMIFPLWQELYKTGISTDTAFFLSDFLRKCSTGNDDYYQESLRIASRAATISERPLKKEELLLLYPENYENFVDTSCKKYDIKKSVVFALIRSESFFDPDITSTAGAIGLTQLMDFTGGDIARRLKYRDYSLEDPETNIEFGTFYFSELYRRCEGSYLQSFFSYNAGITRVRRWLQSSLIEFGKKKDMPMDLFLETLPYAETREYGRKLISASVMYEWLYNPDNLTYTEIIENFVN